jgi:hypothetical protein
VGWVIVASPYASRNDILKAGQVKYHLFVIRKELGGVCMKDFLVL